MAKRAGQAKQRELTIVGGAAPKARKAASIVVAEANNGGAMVASVLKVAHCPVNVKLVRASKGKVARAEPVAPLVRGGQGVPCGVVRQARGPDGGDGRRRRP